MPGGSSATPLLTPGITPLSSEDFVNTSDYRKYGMTFNVFIGGRGGGKTYSTLREQITQQQEFIYCRTTDKQMQQSLLPEKNPFKQLNIDLGWDYGFINKESPLCVDNMSVKGVEHPIVGYGAAITTAGNLRGVSYPNVKEIIWDEFIKLEGEVVRGDIAGRFFDFYETVNRNRELLGQAPVKCWFLSNANSIVSPLLEAWDIIDDLENMVRRGEHLYLNPEKSILLAWLEKTKVSEAKANTALYRAIKGSKYYSMAIENQFAYDNFANVRKRPLNEYTIWFSIDGLYIYKHKSNGRYYVCRTPASCIELDGKEDHKYFLRHYGIVLKDKMIAGKVDYKEMYAKVHLKELLNL